MKLRKKFKEKEEFLNMLRNKNIYIKKNIIKEKKNKKEVIIEEKLNEIISKKKIFKQENSINKLKKVYSDEI